MDPETLRYTESHEWIHLDGDTATVGISPFAVEQLSDLLHIDLPKVGTKLAAGKDFGQIESVKSVSDLYAPVAGEVVAVNEAVAGNIDVLKQSPLERGWLIKLKVDDPGAVGQLLNHAAYQAKVAELDH